MKILLVAFTLLSIPAAFAAPKITNCVSDDQMVMAQLSEQENDSSMVDLKIASNKNDRPAESTFPTRENLAEKEVTYTLLDSDFQMLSVDLETGKGKLSNGQFFSPKPYIEVTCQ